MNWQSDFVSPHMIPNGQNYIQQNSSKPVANITQIPATVQGNFIQTSTNYGQSRYSNSSNISLNPHYNTMSTNPQQYAPQNSYINPTVPHFNNGSNNNTLNNHSSVQDRTKPALYQMPVAHVTVTPGASSSAYNNFKGSNAKVISNPIGSSYSNQNMPNQYQAPKNLTIQIIESLRRNNLKVIAFDFDCTIVNIHTGGMWADSPEKLAEFVRPCFKELIPALLKCPDFFVCVTTYSPQEDLIREVLRIVMKDEYAVNDLVNKIIIKGNTREFVEEHGIENCYSNGKQAHLQFCREFFESLIRKFNKENSQNGPNNLFKIHDDNILLIDDDLQNLKIAYENGHLAFQVNNSIKLVDFYNFLAEI